MFSLKNSKKFNFYTISSDHNWGYEAATSIGFGVNWNMTDQLTLTGNPFISSYYFGPLDYRRRTAAGMNVTLTYQPVDWLILKAFGQYTYNGLINPNSINAPQNSFGGEVYVKFSDTFGLGGGIKYMNYNGKWKPQFYSLPIIRINAFRNK